jgi:serine/threonine-protein kinase
MDQRGGSAPVAVGDHIDGKYVVEAVLGTGGMGMVVRATHVDLNKQIALKFLLADAVQRPDAVERFLREARAVRKLRSEHVVRVLDVGRLTGSGLPYIAMELLEGEDLDRVLRARGPLPFDEACTWIIHACEALAEAHAQGIVHRDLKPGNLFLARQQGNLMVKVLDFGIAKTADTQVSRTRTAAVVGSVLYMSPEQMRSAKKVDPRSDIWSLGVTLFELLGGHPPFDAEDVPALILSVTSDPPRSLRELRPDIPPALEQVVLRCLEKAPDVRISSAGELAMALVPFAKAEALTIAQRAVQRGGPVAPPPPVSSSTGDASAKPAPGLAAAAVSAPRVTDASWGATGSRASRSKTSMTPLLTVGIVLICAAIGVTGLFLWRSHLPEATVLPKGPASESATLPLSAPQPSTPLAVTAEAVPAAASSSAAPAPAPPPPSHPASARPSATTRSPTKATPHKPSTLGSGVD